MIVEFEKKDKIKSVLSFIIISNLMTIQSSVRKFRVIIRFHHFQCYIYTLSYIQDMFSVTHTVVFFCSNVEKETNTCICWYLKLCKWNNYNSNTNKMFSYLKKKPDRSFLPFASNASVYFIMNVHNHLCCTI